MYRGPQISDLCEITGDPNCVGDRLKALPCPSSSHTLDLAHDVAHIISSLIKQFLQSFLQSLTF